MLQLYQDRLQRDFAVTKDRWTQAVSTNTQEMIKLIRNGAEIEDIEKQLQRSADRRLSRQADDGLHQPLQVAKATSTASPHLSKDGTVAGEQLVEAEAERNAARATLQSLVEQIQQDAQQASSISTQSVKELQTRVSVDETNLKILGVRRRCPGHDRSDPAGGGYFPLRHINHHSTVRSSRRMSCCSSVLGPRDRS